MREIVVTIDLESKVLVCTGLVILAVVVGPFATYELMTFWERVMFWSLDVYGGMLIITFFSTVTANSKVLGFMPIYLRIFLGAFIGAIPIAGLITFLFNAIAAPAEIVTPYPRLVIEVAVLSTGILLTEYIVWPALFGQDTKADKNTAAGMVDAQTISEESPADDLTMTNRLMERLPAQYRWSKIVSVSMQDHYAEVTTTSGTTSILMRLSDIEDLLQSYPGSRVHRSHWAASEYAVSISKKGRGHRLLLSDGRTLPVSDKYLSDAKRLLSKADPQDV